MEVAIFCKRARILKYGGAKQNTLVLPKGWSKVVGISETAIKDIDSAYQGLTISTDKKAFKGIEGEVKPISRRQVEIVQEAVDARIAKELGEKPEEKPAVEMTDEEKAEAQKVADEKAEADKLAAEIAESKKGLEAKIEEFTGGVESIEEDIKKLEAEIKSGTEKLTALQTDPKKNKKAIIEADKAITLKEKVLGGRVADLKTAGKYLADLKEELIKFSE